MDREALLKRLDSDNVEELWVIYHEGDIHFAPPFQLS